MTLNCGEKPRIPNPTKLSEILEENADPKYRLTVRACQGILNRAERRGKELPPELKTALMKQSAEDSSIKQARQQGGVGYEEEKAPSLMAGQESAVCYGISAFNSEGMKSPNPHSGIYVADTARTLDLNGGSPACNQGGGWRS